MLTTVLPALNALEYSASPVPRLGRERPSRMEAEAAVQTLIRWAGDDPGRRRLSRNARPGGARLCGMVFGLRGGSARCAPLRNGFRATRRIRSPCFNAPSRRPAATTRWSYCGASASNRIASIIWPHYRPCTCRPSAPRPRRGHLQARAPCGGLCQAPADPGADDGGDRRRDQRGSPAARRRGSP
jgi:hypothetical protein